MIKLIKLGCYILGMSSSATKTWLYLENPYNMGIQVYLVTCGRRNSMIGRR